MARGESAVQIEIDKSAYVQNHQHHQPVPLHRQLNVGTIMVRHLDVYFHAHQIFIGKCIHGVYV